MKNIFKNWTSMRIIRLVIGVFIIIEGARSMEWILLAMGIGVAALPLFNIGCGCSNGSCSVSPSREINHTKQD